VVLISSNDVVIREINQFFLGLKFNKVIINGTDVFEQGRFIRNMRSTLKLMDIL